MKLIYNINQIRQICLYIIEHLLISAIPPKNKIKINLIYIYIYILY